MIRRPPRSTRTDNSCPTRVGAVDDDLQPVQPHAAREARLHELDIAAARILHARCAAEPVGRGARSRHPVETALDFPFDVVGELVSVRAEELRSEEHTSELQSLMRNSYAVFCLKKKN